MTDPQQIIRQMYETAKEVQDAWVPQHGDHYCHGVLHWHIGDATFYTKKSDKKILEYLFSKFPIPILKPSPERVEKLERQCFINKSEYIFIPSQSQLQNMIPQIKKYTFQFYYDDDLLCVKIEWNEWDYDLLSDITLDILWLKIVMRLVYNKTWNEESLAWEKRTTKI